MLFLQGSEEALEVGAAAQCGEVVVFIRLRNVLRLTEEAGVKGTPEQGDSAFGVAFGAFLTFGQGASGVAGGVVGVERLEAGEGIESRAGQILVALPPL